MGLRPAGQVAERSFAIRFAPVLVLALALVLALPALAAADVEGPELVHYVNAMRAAHGIPAGITENPAWSSWCALHNHYGAINDVLTHVEGASEPGFSTGGASAAATSVLYRGLHWTAADNPFEHAPIHLHQLLAPRLDAMGAAESDGFGCATTFASRKRPPPVRDVTYSYPADGASGWQVGEVAEELPITPGELLGLAPGTATGPYLYVLFDGPGIALYDRARVTSASVTGPSGPVELLIADNTTPGLEGYLPVGAELIPRRALEPGARYTAAVSATVGTTRFTRRWSFTTGPSAANIGSDNAVASSVTPTAARSARTAGTRGVHAVRRGNTLQVQLRCPRSCLVRGMGQLRSGGSARWLPDARAGRLMSGRIRLRFALDASARRWIAVHRTMHLRLSVSGLFVTPLRATLRYAPTIGSSSAYLPLASSVPASG